MLSLAVLTILLVGMASAIGPDFDNNNKVDGADLGTLLGQWGEVTSDNNNAFADLNKDFMVDGSDVNVLLSFWGEYAPMPDLVLSNLQYTISGNLVSVTATVKNIGFASSGENTVSISLGGDEAEASISQLAVDQEFTFQWTFFNRSPKGLQINAWADVLDQVAESDEGNNFKSLLILGR